MTDLSGWVTKGYEIREVIDKGGFGAVYRASQSVIGREVAIKVILPSFANQPEFIRRFETEAQLIARLEHPHIVPLYDYWRDPDGAYLVMRWLRGGSLRSLLQSERLDLYKVALIIEQISGALTIAHRNGVVHRDLKPENILLDEDGNAYLSDFGIAKDLTAQSDDEDVMTGSPAYVSPEQITSQNVTPRTDVYSLGLMLYELLTGEQPFNGDKVATVILKQLREPVPKLSLVRPELLGDFDSVVQRATQKDPQDRFPDVLSMSAALWRAVHSTENDINDTVEFSAVPPPLRETLVITNLTTMGFEEVRNPYKGLRSFEAVDADHFFGREKLTTQLISRMAEDDPLKRFLAVVGPSGSGKSSVVKAGLMPALRQGGLPGSRDWFLVEMVPGMHPLEELESALLRVAVNKPDNLREILRRDARGLAIAAQSILPQDGSSELALFIDQFEEAFTLVTDPDETAHFLDLLASAVVDPYCSIRVVITLRADFYDRPLMHSTFSELMSKRTVVVTPLTPSELERAVSVPAETVGVMLEPKLVSQIIDEVKHEPGTLPLLQYALTELFDRHEGRNITLSAYNKLGGVLGALARRADEIYDTLSPESKLAAKQLFLRLVTLGEGTEDTRRRVPMSELLTMGISRAEIDNVIDVFGKHRLLTFDRDPISRAPTVEVAHEAIIREWNQLKMWLDASREDVRQQRRLAILLSEWVNANRDASFLLRGAQLQQFEYWRDSSQLALADVEREFLQASIDAREADLAAERARQKHEQELELRARQIQRNLLIFVSVLAIVAVFFAGFAFTQRADAERSAATAMAAEDFAIAESNNLATSAAIAQERADELQSLSLADAAENAIEDNNADLALVLAIEANRLPEPPFEAQHILSDLISAATTRLYAGGHTDRVNMVVFSPDGHTLLSAGGDSMLSLWNFDNSQLIRQMQGSSPINGAAYLPDGTHAVTGGNDGTLTLWDLNTGEVVRIFGADGSGHTDAVFSVAVSPDGVNALSGSRDETLILWDIATGQVVRRFSEGLTDRVTSVAISPDGELGIAGSADNTAIVWELATGEILWRLQGHEDIVTSVAFSNDGNLALTGSADNSVMMWNMLTGAMVRRFDGHRERVTSVAFSPDGRLAASGSGSPFAGGSLENAVILWDVLTGSRLVRYDGHSSQVTSVAFSPDGMSIVSGSTDATMRLWSIEPDIEIARLQENIPIADFALSADGTRALTANTDLSLTLWDTQTLTQVWHVESGHSERINAVAIDAAGTRALTAADDRTLILWDLATGTAIRTLNGHANRVTDVVFTADGLFAVSGSRDRTLILWNLDESSAMFGQAVRIFETRHTNIINAVAVNHDGTMALSASADRSLILWDIATGTAIRTFTGHEADVLSVAFSPDGSMAISGSADKTLILWNVATGQMIRQFGTTSTDATLDVGHTDWVTSVIFSPDGEQVISGSRDRSVRVWDVATGQEVLHFGAVNGRGGHSDSITSVAANPDGRRLYSAGLDGTLRIFPYSLDVLLRWIEDHRYVRSLSCDERVQFRVEPLCEVENLQTP